MADPRLDANGELPPDDHVIRYCPFGRLRPDGTPSATAFLPDGDGYLSVFWLEFAGIADDETRWDDMRRRMAASAITLRAQGKLAELAVGVTKLGVAAELSHSLAIRHMPVLNDGKPEPDPSHSGIHGIPREPLDVADLIASRYVSDLRPAKG